jgi:hypothetical protein
MLSLASFHIKHWILVEINTKPTACFHIRGGSVQMRSALHCLLDVTSKLWICSSAPTYQIANKRAELRRAPMLNMHIYLLSSRRRHHVCLRIIRFALHSAASSYVYATIHAWKSSLCACAMLLSRVAFMIIESFLAMNATLLMTLWCRESLLGWESYTIVTFCLLRAASVFSLRYFPSKTCLRDKLKLIFPLYIY